MQLLELADNQCRWPLGLDAFGVREFCGSATPRRGLPYCEEHMKAAYLPAALRRLNIRGDYYNATGALPHHAAA